MEDMPISLARCSGCGSSSFTASGENVPICDYCGTLYGPADPHCPRCEAPYDLGTRSCPSCGAFLARECPICGTLNPLMARQCVVCGQTVDATDALFARLTTRTPDQLRRVRRAGAEIKAQQESASQARLKEMWADEERWREEQAIARAERERQERLIIALAIALVAIAVVVAVVIAAGF